MNDYKIVQFDIWCPQCKYWKMPEDEDPCHSCLNESANFASTQPVKFELNAKAKPIKHSCNRELAD